MLDDVDVDALEIRNEGTVPAPRPTHSASRPAPVWDTMNHMPASAMPEKAAWSRAKLSMYSAPMTVPFMSIILCVSVSHTVTRPWSESICLRSREAAAASRDNITSLRERCEWRSRDDVCCAL